MGVAVGDAVEVLGLAGAVLGAVLVAGELLEPGALLVVLLLEPPQPPSAPAAASATTTTTDDLRYLFIDCPSM